MSVWIVLPTYNERENLDLMARTLLALPVEGLRLLVVDDDSPDGTGLVADSLAGAAPGRVAVLHRRGRRGLGLAYRDGFRRALDEGADAIVQMDADFSHDPADVPRLVERLSSCDVAVGSRYAPGGSIGDDWSRGRRNLSRSANAYARTILRIRTRDATAGFKAWRREALAAVDLDRVRSKGYLFMVEMAYVCERLGLDVCEVPVHFSERRAGRSKMSLKAKVEAAAGIAGVWHRHHALASLR